MVEFTDTGGESMARVMSMKKKIELIVSVLLTMSIATALGLKAFI